MPNYSVAIIPARGGSKRIPGKNIKPFHGKPVISYAIELTLASKLFDQVLVSTECSEIARIASTAGASVPFTRPIELADDFTGTGPVINHAINWLQDNGFDPEFVCCIYPATPLLTVDLLSLGYKTLVSNPDKSFAFSVCKYSYPVNRSLIFNENKEICMLFPENAGERTQDLAEVFHDAGQFYWGRSAAFLRGESMFGSAAIPIFLPRQRAIDMDDLEDWNEAEAMFELLSGNMSRTK